MAVRGSYFPFKNTDQVQDRHVHRCRARRRGVGGGGACSSSSTPCLVTPARARCCAAEVSGQRLPLRIVDFLSESPEESSHVKVFHGKVRVSTCEKKPGAPCERRTFGSTVGQPQGVTSGRAQSGALAGRGRGRRMR